MGPALSEPPNLWVGVPSVCVLDTSRDRGTATNIAEVVLENKAERHVSEAEKTKLSGYSGNQSKVQSYLPLKRQFCVA